MFNRIRGNMPLFLFFWRITMLEIEDEVIFHVEEDGAKFTTVTNGDILIINDFHLTREQAATLAWLVNSNQKISVQMKLI